jgi:hypothetical protein
MRLVWGAGLVWACLVWTNALPGHALNLDWVWRFFWPPVGRWTWGQVGAAQARNAGALVALALFDLAAWAAGARVVAWVRGGPLPGIFGLGVTVAAGMAVLGVAAAALGLAGLAYPVVVVLLLAMALASLRRLPAFGDISLRGIPWPLAVLGGVLVLAGLLGALAPEVTTDALRHWLEAPRQALLLHRIVAAERWPLGWLPLQPVGENLCLVAVAGDVPVRLLSWQASAFVAAALLAWGGSWGPVVAVGWLAGLNHVVLAQLAWTDMRAAAWVLLAAYAQFAARRSRLAGLCWGAAVATKPQAAIFLAAAVGGEALARRPLAAARLAGWSLWPLLPWLARNWLGAGSPLAPWGSDLLVAFFLPQREWLRHESWTAVLAAPFTAATAAASWDGLLSPALVAVLPLAACAGPGALASSVALVPTAALALAGWAWTAGYAGRYLVPAVPLLLVACALGAGRLAVPARVRGAVTGALALAFAWEGAVSIALAFYIFNPSGVALGRETPARYLERVLAPRPATWGTGRVLRRHVAVTARVYVSGTGEAHYWPGVPVLEAEGLAPPLAAWGAAAPAAARLRVVLRQRGVRWLVDEETGAALIPGLHPAYEAWTPRARGRWREVLARWGRPVAVTGDGTGRYALWAVDLRAHPPIRLPARTPATGYP